MICHDGSNPHLRNLNGYDNLKKVTERDTGTDVFTLVRVSHIHLFGLTFVFFIMGLMYSHAYVRPVWFKCTIVALPFVAIAMDVSSWYFTKLYHPFAWVVIVSGRHHGRVLRVHVGRDDVPDVARATACRGRGKDRRRDRHRRLTARSARPKPTSRCSRTS